MTRKKLGMFGLAAVLLLTAAKAAPTWKEIQGLVDDQKFEEAYKAAKQRLDAARDQRDEAEITRGLIKVVQLRIGLHGYETAVRALKTESWPAGPKARAVLHLYYASSLITYLDAYSWEINQREKVDTKGEVDLKAWTRDQILAESQRAYEEVWKLRAELGKEPVAEWGEFLNPNTYPKEIRGTLRDAVTYLRVQSLANSAYWRPEHSNELFRLNRDALIAGDPKGSAKLKLDDPEVHPLLRVSALLDDLESWHQQSGHEEAALEARVKRLELLHGALTDAGDRKAIRAALEAKIATSRGLPWSAWAIGALAEMQRDAGELKLAHATASEGMRLHPKSLGARRCEALVRGLEAPDFQLNSMSSDGLNKRSIEVNHRNLPRLHLRAYAVDLEKWIAQSRDYYLLPQGDEVQKLLAGKPEANWSVDLPATPDFQSHRTYVTPPLKGSGLFVVVASARADFQADGNRVLAAPIVVGELAMIVRDQREEQETEVQVVQGETGVAVPGVEVLLYRLNYNASHAVAAKKTTDKGGLARFKAEKNSGSYFLVAKKGEQLALASQSFGFYRGSRSREVNASLVFTDRSIYRPQQKLLWKVVGYSGNSEKASFKTSPNLEMTVNLHDPNGERVESKPVKTNAFGSASGEFAIPTGRLLGNWTVRTSVNGYASVRVEEYKRPTFEVSMLPTEGALRLNKPATLTGEAKYYFGLPVTRGKVRWVVERSPIYPWWWWWWGGGNRGAQTQKIASGTAELGDNGRFKLTFTPEADEQREKALSFNYTASVDLTDEGGETRSAKQSVRLGFVAVEATLTTETEFLRAGEGGTVNLRRTSLDGAPRAGKGSWKLVALKAPDKAVSPADEPIPAPPGEATGMQTPGDRLRPRWAPDLAPMRTVSSWPDGAQQAAGEVTHGADGNAVLKLPKLQAGAYRLRYGTTDDFGAKFDTFKDLIVAAPQLSLPVAGILLAEKSGVKVGETARLLVHSGIPGQTLVVDKYRAGARVERKLITAGKDSALIELPVTADDRGGFSISVSGMRDYQLISFSTSIFVPWDNKELKLELSTFRDKIRPGSQETWKVTLKGERPEKAALELLAYMYDQSLDSFGPHSPPSALNLYPGRAQGVGVRSNLGMSYGQWVYHSTWFSLPSAPGLGEDHLKFHDGYGIGGMGTRGGGGYRTRSMALAEGNAFGGRPPAAPAAAMPLMKAMAADRADASSEREQKRERSEPPPPPGEAPAQKKGDAPGPELRSNFAETAFWKPHLTIDGDGSAAIEFTVPDSVTRWNVWVHGLTRDLRGGSVTQQTQSVKELMVRPYLPRFLREGDQAIVQVVVNNASSKPMEGKLRFEIFDPENNASLLAEFGSKDGTHPFKVEAGKSTTLTFPLTAPRRVGQVAFKVTATAGDLSDGELRPLPLLPSRMHLAQSRFVTLKNQDSKTMKFADLAGLDDPSLINEQLVVTIDAQLFYSVLNALPYLVNYPYECTEQTLNRFVSSGIVSSLYTQYPSVAKMAQSLSSRETRLETFDALDPNRKLLLEETPWLNEARGSDTPSKELTNVLNPKVAAAESASALVKLQKSQTAIGGFPWWPGGPPSPYMTLYIAHGLGRAAEYKVAVPKEMVQRAWQYLAKHYREELAPRLKDDCCWEFITFLNYVASSYPDSSWTGDALTLDERKQLLDFSFRHWKRHSPYLKGYLALTLKRMGREADAKKVFDSVMDSAKTTPEDGTFWAPEDRAWLWYNDTIESHAFALRALIELDPKDARRDGLVQWLLINKKLNQWKSTRATAEVIYALVKYLEQEKQLGARENSTVQIGPRKTEFVFEPDKYTGKKNQVVVPGAQIDPKTMSTITVSKTSPGFQFASATWHFSTEKLPKEDRGDLFAVSRKHFKRVKSGREVTLQPLADGAKLEVGDELEVQLSLRSRHAAEYVHLRDPRAAGLEPENQVSRYQWHLGIGWYEEIRDSGTNFFFEQLPAGEYPFKYRVRVAMAGTFKIGPATVQSMYAPEFTAYSAGHVLKLEGAK
jgi:uncharacterized protein YfaS (alpha-2-macroglobulin family)